MVRPLGLPLQEVLETELVVAGELDVGVADDDDLRRALEISVQGLQPVDPGGVDDDRRAVGRAQLMEKQVAPQADVQGDLDDPGPGRGEPDRQVLAPARELGRDPVAGLESDRRQGVRQSIGAELELRIGDRPGFETDELSLGRVLGAGPEDRAEGVVACIDLRPPLFDTLPTIWQCVQFPTHRLVVDEMTRTRTQSDERLGRRIPGGSFEVEAHLARLWAEANDLPIEPGVIHPSYIPVLALDGLDATIEEILVTVGTRPEDGGVAGGCGLELIGPVEIGETYRVECEITEVDHKAGRRTGPFDRVTTMMTMTRSADSEVVARSWIVWIVPCEESDAEAW